jgi:hypothetical protein
LPSSPLVGEKEIGVESAARPDVLVYFRVDCFLSPVRNHGGTHVAGFIFGPALKNSHHGGLVLASGTGDAALALGNVHVPRFTADEGFIRFDVAGQLLARVHTQAESNPVIQKPRGLLGYVQVAGDFATADAVFAVDDEPHRGKPFVDPDGRVLHHRSGLQRELRGVVLGAAMPAVVLFQEEHVFATAARAGDAFGPPAAYQILAAVSGIGEVKNRFLKAGGLLFHS